MTKNLVKCIGKDISFHPNTVINFNGSGLVLGVSLNIEKHLIGYLSPNNIKKGEKMYLLSYSKQLQSEQVDVFNIKLVHDILLKRLQRDIAFAKSKYFNNKAKNIKIPC